MSNSYLAGLYLSTQSLSSMSPPFCTVAEDPKPLGCCFLILLLLALLLLALELKLLLALLLLLLLLVLSFPLLPVR